MLDVMALVPAELTSLVLRLADPTPEPEEVKAGWTAFAVFLLLIGALVLLGFSLVKQLRRAEAAKKAGVYGDPVETEAADDVEPHSR